MKILTAVMKPKYLLQLGLAFVLLFAGLDAALHPADWIGFVPTWVSDFGLSRLVVLHLHSAAEIILGLWLLTSWRQRLAASLVAADILAIILVNGLSRGVLLVTFRDVGLFFMALYLSLS